VPGLRRSGRAGREVLLAVAAATTVTFAAAGSFQLLGVASSQARAAVLIGQVQVQAPGLVNAVFAPLNGQRVVGAGVVPPESLITAELRELRSLGLGSADVAALTAATDRLFGAVHLVESKAQAGDHAGANAVAIREMVDAQSALTAEDGIVLARVGRASGTATAQARVGVLGLLIGTVVVVAGLLLVGGRRRGRARQAAAAQFEALVYSSTDLIGVTNGEGVLTYASPSLHQALGSASELIWAERIHPEDLPVVEAALASIRATPDHAAHVEFKVRHHDGRSLTLEATVTNKLTDGELGGFLWNARDVSDRKALEDQLLRQALQDPLTGLANRIVLRDRLSNALARAARHHRLVGLLLFDLDGFKEINDDAGHAAGDAVLIEVATRLARHLRSVDTVARLGGDEFAMVVDDLADETDVDGAAARVVEVLEEPITVGSRQFRVTASVGKVMCVGDQDPDEALRHADIAMYAAKAAGKARVVTFEPVMAERVQARLPRRHTQDRQVVRRQRRAPGQPAGQGHREHGRQPAHDHRGGGDRSRRPSRSAARAGLRHRPGFPLRPSRPRLRFRDDGQGAATGRRRPGRSGLEVEVAGGAPLQPLPLVRVQPTWRRAGECEHGRRPRKAGDDLDRHGHGGGVHDAGPQERPGRHGDPPRRAAGRCAGTQGERAGERCPIGSGGGPVPGDRGETQGRDQRRGHAEHEGQGEDVDRGRAVLAIRRLHGARPAFGLATSGVAISGSAVSSGATAVALTRSGSTGAPGSRPTCSVTCTRTRPSPRRKVTTASGAVARTAANTAASLSPRAAARAASPAASVQCSSAETAVMAARQPARTTSSAGRTTAVSAVTLPASRSGPRVTRQRAGRAR